MEVISVALASVRVKHGLKADRIIKVEGMLGQVPFSDGALQMV